MMLLTKSTTFIIGPIATALGWIMNAIFWLQEQIGIPNIGLCIILFTFVIYMLLLPLTYQQQKFSKMSALMNPELQEIQNKYKDKQNDQAAMTKMNDETQAVYKKYGVNPMGSCLQLLIQMPILFALYRVIWNVPAYVTSVYNAFGSLAEELMDLTGIQEFMETAAEELSVTFNEMTMDTMVDVLYKFKPANWTGLMEAFPGVSSSIAATQETVDQMNYFLGLNIADSPWTIITTGFAAGSILLVIGAALIPILSALTQWMNAKLASAGSNSANGSNAAQDSTAGMMRSMNAVMPIMSAVFCLTLPVGMGLYWIAGAVIRSVQQVAVNHVIGDIDKDALIKKNQEKEDKRRAKEGLPPQKISSNARINTKNIEVQENRKTKEEDKAQRIKDSTEYYQNTSKAKPGSLAAKAQMVQQYNERNRKK